MSSRMHSRAGVAPAPRLHPPHPPSRREKDSKRSSSYAHMSASAVSASPVSVTTAVSASAGACRRQSQACSRGSKYPTSSPRISAAEAAAPEVDAVAETDAAAAAGKTVAIIGAGVSGLTCIKSCLEEGLHPVCFEASKEIGGVWVYREEVIQNGPGRLYRSAVTNTSKEMMGFSDFPPPPHFPPFLRHEKLLEYYESYAEFFGLTASVKTETEVVDVEKADDHVISGRWVVTVRSTSRDSLNSKENEECYAEFCQGSPGPAFPAPFYSKPSSSGSAPSTSGSAPILKRLVFDAVIVCTGILGKKNLPAEEYEGYFQFEARNGDARVSISES